MLLKEAPSSKRVKRFRGRRPTIDAWRMISAEEAAEQAFDALANNDFVRLQALFISDDDMKFLNAEDKSWILSRTIERVWPFDS